jgi:hypothetical protein
MVPMSDLGHSNIYLPLHTNLKEYNRYTLATKHNLVLKDYSKPSSHLLSSKRDKHFSKPTDLLFIPNIGYTTIMSV